MSDITPNTPAIAAPQNLADFVLARLGTADDKAAASRDFFTNITPAILEQMSAATDIPFPSQTYYSECIRLSGRTNRAMPENWPVINIQKALWLGQTPMLVGSLKDLALGKVQIAIDQGLRGFRVASGYSSPGAEIFVDYSAGYDILPADLLEVFVEWCLLVGKEKDRVGMKSIKSDVGLVTFARDLPKWAQATLWRYRRTEFYVS